MARLEFRWFQKTNVNKALKGKLNFTNLTNFAIIALHLNIILCEETRGSFVFWFHVWPAFIKSARQGFEEMVVYRFC